MVDTAGSFGNVASDFRFPCYSSARRKADKTIRVAAAVGLVLAQAETIAAPTRECEALRARVAELEANLNLPQETPDNSSTPPCHGRKASGWEIRTPNGKPHAGAHRPLHRNQATRRDVLAASRQHCGADVSQRLQSACEAYDHVEIPAIKPDVTSVALFGGTCLCRTKRFRAPLHGPCGRSGSCLK
ncbi:MAG: hypothetical protein ACREDM_13905 [Methylocella sp.]